MVAITGSSLGYAGEVTDLSGRDYWNRLGASKYGVGGADDLKVSKTTGDRMLLVASGVAWGHNIQDTLETALSVQLSSVASGSRWDLVVVRRDVAAKSSIEVVQGTSERKMPSLTSTAASHPDQPLALCRVAAGSTTVEEIIDLRCWASSGGVQIVDSLALTYLASPGAEVRLGGVEWRHSPGDNNVWGWTSYPLGDTEWRDLPTTLGFTPNTSSGWSGVKYRVTNGTLFLNGSVARGIAWPADYTCCVIPFLLAPQFKTQGAECQVNPNGNVELPAGSVAASFSASWPIKR